MTDTYIVGGQEVTFNYDKPTFLDMISVIETVANAVVSDEAISRKLSDRFKYCRTIYRCRTAGRYQRVLRIHARKRNCWHY